ncbi:MAG: molybdopterin-dependent oxidoreductase [Sinobacteraceae bacterium]|nr:molybdopterin-dependent oxidoreductase [Nevskiaceae bacterium]
MLVSDKIRGYLMLTRRELMAASAAVLASSREALASEAGLVALPDKKPLIARSFRPPNFETPLADLRQPFTRNDAFFVRYHLPVIPEIDTSDWTLAIAGPGTERELTLSLRDLRRDFERVAIPAVNQCSGNRRRLFVPRVPGVQWEHGAMGHALWGGVRLADVLRRAGVRPDAVKSCSRCADAGVLPRTGIRQESADRPGCGGSTLIAFEITANPCPPSVPARLVVPDGPHLLDEASAHDSWCATLRRLLDDAYRLPLGAFPCRFQPG